MMISWINAHKFQTHLTAFVVMILASIGLYFAANLGPVTLTWALLGGFVLANGLTILVR